MNGLANGPPVRRLIPMNVVLPDHEQSLENAKSHVLRIIRAQLDVPSKRLVTDKGVKIQVMYESPFDWFWDQDREMLVDEKVVRHVYDSGEIDFDTLLDRPLRGLPCVGENMYGRMGLCPIACSDLTNDGGCVLAQLVETVMKRERKDVGGDQRGGRPGTENYTDNRKRQATMVPRFTAEYVSKAFDQIFSELYPGEAILWNDY